jgi:GAF domain-containing protein
VERFLTPIINIRDNLVALAKGNFPKNLDYDMTDEINDTTIALNNLVERLKNSTNFAKAIGEGNLNAQYYGKQTQDVLTTSLLRMQQSLKRIEEDNNRRKWATEGFAIHGELFRKNNTNINQLGEAFIRSIVPYINGVHGAVYAVSHVGSSSGVISLQEDDTYFELIGTYATEIKEESYKKFRLGQGLVGQCAREKQTIIVNDESQSINFISSGLGKSKASHLLCVPMILNQQVMGVVELSSFEFFPKHVIEFIEMLGESFASAVMNVKNNYQTLNTLKEFEHTTEKLMHEQEELKHRYENALEEINLLREKLNKQTALE